jgi:hypothetical protein
MDTALFLTFFLFVVQIAAGVAPMRWPEQRWLAEAIFGLSMAGTVACLVWYGYSNQDWFIETMGQKTFGIVIVIAAVALGAIGLSLVGAPDPKRDPKAKGPPSYSGKIIPELLLSSSNKKILRQMEIGDSTSIINFAGPAGNPLFLFGEGYGLTIEQAGDELKVSTKVKDKQGKLVAELQQNEWTVAPPPKTWDRNYNKHALEVKDDTGSIVLQVRLLPDRVQIQGEWWMDGGLGLRVVKDPRGGGAFALFAGSVVTPGTPSIQPIFKYPSASHFGELKP